MITPLKKQHQILSSPQSKINTSSSHYLPLNSNKLVKKQSKLKFNHLKNAQNLQSSQISKQSSKSTHLQSSRFHIKLPNAFYNDSKASLYLNKSKSMSQKSVCYQARPLSLTQRNKLQSSRLENIVSRRKTEIQNDQNLEKSLQDEGLPQNRFSRQKRSQSSTHLKFLSSSRISRPEAVNRPMSQSVLDKLSKINQTYGKPNTDKFKNHTFEKYNKLVYGAKLKEIEKKLLNKDISRICSQRTIKKKWYPPFESANTLRQQFQGKKIASSSTIKQGNQSINSGVSNTELKVLNIDRMFRKKQGKLTNVVPLQMPKFSQLTAIKNINLLTKKKNHPKLHDIIDEFNTLLRISKLKKARSSSKIIGVKGKNFTKNPSFEELMGLKLRPKTNLYLQQSEEIPVQVFLQHSSTYKEAIKQSFSLTSNFIEGIKQHSKSLDLQVVTRFYSLFVNKVATMEQKVVFFSFFMIPSNKENIRKQGLIDILAVLCKDKSFPALSINVKTQTLSEQQKARIFFEALTRVMFGQVDDKETIDRVRFVEILRENEEAVDLLLKLIEKEE